MILAKLALAANALKNAIPWQIWAILGAILLAWMWGNSRYNAGQESERAQQERRIIEAQIAAVEAEREAQAKHDEREAQRHSHTTDLRKAVAEAPVGQKTKAVLDALRGDA